MGAVEHVKTICCLGLPPESAMMAVTPLLHEIIPHGWTRFGVFRQSDTVIGGWSEHPDTAKIYRERHREVLKEPGVGPVFVREAQAVGIGWSLPLQGRDWLGSAWYREMEAPLDACWVLDAMVGESGLTYAALALARPRGAKPFTADDVQRLDPLRPWLAHAIRPAARTQARREDEERPGIVGLPVLSGQLIVTVGGAVVHQTRTADHLLLFVEGGVRRGDALPQPVAKLVQRIVGAANGRLCEPPRMRVSSPYGVHTLEAKWLIPAGAAPADVAKDPKGCLIAVSIELHEHPVAHAARALRSSGATPAQVKVGVKLALGKTKPEIADAFGVKESTVADLTRKLYRTLDVHNSAELGARIWLSSSQESARQYSRSAN
jgi:DNA-binding CsgD family transcriptional regulator